MIEQKLPVVQTRNLINMSLSQKKKKYQMSHNQIILTYSRIVNGSSSWMMFHPLVVMDALSLAQGWLPSVFIIQMDSKYGVKRNLKALLLSDTSFFSAERQQTFYVDSTFIKFNYFQFSTEVSTREYMYFKVSKMYILHHNFIHFEAKT